MRYFAMTAALDDLKVLDAEPGAFWLGAWHGINSMIWLAPAKLDVVRRLDRAILARAKQRPGLMSTVHIATSESGPPEPDARDALIEMNQARADLVACGAVVIERGGLLGIALRSAVTGIIIVAPKHFRVKVFDALEPCAPWVAEQHRRSTNTAVDATALLEVLRRARASAL